MFFKSNILNVVSEERRSQNIDDSASSFKLMLLESSIQVKEVKLKNTIDEVVNYFLDNRIYIPKDTNNNIRKREDGVVSSGYILIHINELRNKMGKGILTHKDFYVLPNYEGLRDRVKEIFKMEIFKKRQEVKRLQEEEDDKRAEEILRNVKSEKEMKHNYVELSNNMHYIKGIMYFSELMEYLFNNNIIIPADSWRQDNFNSRKLVYLIHQLKNKPNLKDLDFDVLPSYDGFRYKVKKLLGFEK